MNMEMNHLPYSFAQDSLDSDALSNPNIFGTLERNIAGKRSILPIPLAIMKYRTKPTERRKNRGKGLTMEKKMDDRRMSQ